MNILSHPASLLLLVFATLLMSSDPAHAQTARRDAAANPEALGKLQAMLRDATAQRDTAKADNAKLQEEVESLKKKLDNAKRQAAQADKREATSEQVIERYKQNDAALRERIQEQNDKTQQIVDKYKELVATLREVETQRANLQVMVTSQAREIDKCVDANVALYNTGLELADAYEKKGVWRALTQAEPVAQMGRVKMENLMQDYRLRLQDAKVAVSGTASHHP